MCGTYYFQNMDIKIFKNEFYRQIKSKMTSVTIFNMKAEPIKTETHKVLKYIKSIENVISEDDMEIVNKHYKTRGYK